MVDGWRAWPSVVGTGRVRPGNIAAIDHDNSDGGARGHSSLAAIDSAKVAAIAARHVSGHAGVQAGAAVKRAAASNRDDAGTPYAALGFADNDIGKLLRPRCQQGRERTVHQPAL